MTRACKAAVAVALAAGLLPAAKQQYVNVLFTYELLEDSVANT